MGTLLTEKIFMGAIYCCDINSHCWVVIGLFPTETGIYSVGVSLALYTN